MESNGKLIIVDPGHVYCDGNLLSELLLLK